MPGPIINSTEECTCFELLKQGPCQEDEWFVLDPESGDILQAICVTFDCDSPDKILDADGKCKSKFDVFCLSDDFIQMQRQEMSLNPYGKCKSISQ